MKYYKVSHLHEVYQYYEVLEGFSYTQSLLLLWSIRRFLIYMKSAIIMKYKKVSHIHKVYHYYEV